MGFHVFGSFGTFGAGSPYVIPIAVKITDALQFYATGTFQQALGSIGGISQSAVSSTIVPSAIPSAIGVIDYTHVPIQSPPENDFIYINHKRTHSINIQVICDATCKATHVFTNYPGSTHDWMTGQVAVKRQWLSIKNMADDTVYPLKEHLGC